MTVMVRSGEVITSGLWLVIRKPAKVDGISQTKSKKREVGRKLFIRLQVTTTARLYVARTMKWLLRNARTTDVASKTEAAR